MNYGLSIKFGPNYPKRNDYPKTSSILKCLAKILSECHKKIIFFSQKGKVRLSISPLKIYIKNEDLSNQMFFRFDQI